MILLAGVQYTLEVQIFEQVQELGTWQGSVFWSCVVRLSFGTKLPYLTLADRLVSLVKEDKSLLRP